MTKKSFDLLQPVIKKIVPTTMYEVNDSGREYEFHGDSYVKSFIEFIRSLEYEVEPGAYPGSTGIKINGIDFELDVTNASYMARNAYTRKQHIRKDVNRFVAVKKKYYADGYILKVHFNKELSVDKLKSKIQDAIDLHVKRNEDIADAERIRENNLISIADNFLVSKYMKTTIGKIKIHQGIISFYFNDEALSLNIKSNGTLIEAVFFPQTMKSKEDIEKLRTGIDYRIETLELVAEIIADCNKLSDELIQFAADCHHGYFYIKSMSTKR